MSNPTKQLPQCRILAYSQGSEPASAAFAVHDIVRGLMHSDQSDGTGADLQLIGASGNVATPETLGGIDVTAFVATLSLFPILSGEA